MKIILKVFFIFSTVNILIYSQELNNYVQAGLDFANEKKYIEAIKSFTKALEIDSNYSEVYCHRGLAKFEMKDFYGAIKDFKYTLNSGLNDERYIFLALYSLGLSYFNIGRYEEAISYLDSALILNPKSSEIYLERGKSKINLGNIEEGCKDFSKAGELGSIKAYDFIQEYCINSLLSEEGITWLKYSETIHFNGYYDENINYVSDHIYQITTKTVINDKNYEEAKQAMLGESNSTLFKNLKSIVQNYYIDINNGKTRIIDAAFYNRDNTLIGENKNFDKVYEKLGNDGWSKPMENSIQATLVEVVRKKYKK